MPDLLPIFPLKLDKKTPSHPEQFITFEVAHYVGFSLEQEYEFLCIPTEHERQIYLIERKTPMPLGSGM
jgi:hypothetical protein